jgi:tRNA G18 (ribose-2'-O)-methylase SpoU
MAQFVHQRHKPPQHAPGGRDLVIACPPMRSNVNLSRIVRAAGCFGIQRVIACGHARLDANIARDGAESVRLQIHRTLPPILKELAREGFRLVGLEQTTNSQCLYEFPFPLKTALIVGNERSGISDEVLGMLHDVVEIPVYGLPYSHNAATAAAMAMYEYCRQHGNG